MQRAGLIHKPLKSSDHSTDVGFTRPRNASLKPVYAEHARLILQRTAGNQAVLRPLGQRYPEALAAPSGGPSWDFSRIPVHPAELREAVAQMPVEAVPTISFIRPKLKVGVVDDPLEHEADRAAEQVMRPPKLDPSGTLAPPQTSRKCAASEGEARLSVQAKPMEALNSITKDARAFVHQAARTPGEPLGTSTRALFEPRFGHDF